MRKIIIIGASSGIGAAVARDMARAGWRVGVAARRTEPLKKLAAEMPDNISWARIDITSADAAGSLYDLIEEVGGMDVILLASGAGFQDMELDENLTDTILTTNVVGFARIINAAYRYFRSTDTVGRGLIAAVTSVAGTKGIGIAAAYSSSKRFQQTYIDALDQLARRQGVDVDFCDIRPGFVLTPMLGGDHSRYPMALTADEAATLVEAAILKRKRVATIDWRWSVVESVWRLIPRWIWTRMQPGLDS